MIEILRSDINLDKMRFKLLTDQEKEELLQHFTGTDGKIDKVDLALELREIYQFDTYESLEITPAIVQQFELPEEVTREVTNTLDYYVKLIFEGRLKKKEIELKDKEIELKDKEIELKMKELELNRKEQDLKDREQELNWEQTLYENEQMLKEQIKHLQGIDHSYTAELKVIAEKTSQVRKMIKSWRQLEPKQKSESRKQAFKELEQANERFIQVLKERTSQTHQNNALLMEFKILFDKLFK